MISACTTDCGCTSTARSSGAIPIAYGIGLLRLRALPSYTYAQPNAPPVSHAQFTLEVAAAPGLEWQSLVSLRIHKAIDDRGQNLEQPRALFGLGTDNPYHAAAIDVEASGKPAGS